MTNFVKGFVYVLYNDRFKKKIYIGSTTNSLKGRLYDHLANYENYIKNINGGNKQLSKCSSYEIMKHTGETKIELLEEIELDKSKISYRCPLHKRERYYIQKYKDDENVEIVNIRIPTRKMKEWREDNKEYIKEYKKHYYQQNRDKELQYQKEYYLKNREKRLLQMKLNRLRKLREEAVQEDL